VPAAVPAGCRYGIRRPEALLAATCRQSGSLPARVRSASRRCRGRRGDCAGPLRSGFAGCGAPEAADGSVRKDALPAPFLSGLLPPRCASLLVREPQRIGEAAQGARQEIVGQAWRVGGRGQALGDRQGEPAGGQSARAVLPVGLGGGVEEA